MVMPEGSGGGDDALLPAAQEANLMFSALVFPHLGSLSENMEAINPLLTAFSWKLIGLECLFSRYSVRWRGAPR